jgi:glycosyltransferase involved in cell wall biosynthesis
MNRFPKIILIFLAVDWPIFMRRQMIYALASAAKKYDTTVVAINRPLCPLSTVLKKTQRIGEIFGKSRLEKLDDHLYLFSPKYFIHDFVANRNRLLEKLNLSALRRAYRNLQKRLNINEQNPIVWYYYPQQGYVGKLFERSFCIYEIYDNLVDYEGQPLPFAEKLQARHRDSVNLLLTASRKQREKYSPLYEHAKFFGNGLARQTYESLIKDNISIPPEIEKINRPRIGFVGMISNRLNWNLITKLAGEKPEWQFIFVGPVADRTIEQNINKYDNIHFLGARDISQIPAVLAGLDVGLMPYLDNDFFRFSNPLKFYEYAAAGLPSVSSNMEELNDFPGELVKIVPDENIENWMMAIDRFIKADKDTIQKIGREIASKYIWEEMTAILLREIKSEYFK